MLALSSAFIAVTAAGSIAICCVNAGLPLWLKSSFRTFG
jgi:hypothetical protein